MSISPTIRRKHSRIVKRRISSTAASVRIVRKEASIKKFVDEFYQKYGEMMSKLSHE
jgi:hypothetical protein